MPKVTCYVGELKGLPLDGDLEVHGHSISYYFQQASILISGSPAIDLTIDFSRRKSLQPQGGLGVDEGQLQNALTQLLEPAGSSDEGYAVGLILADSYQGAGDYVYGFMFDLDRQGPPIGPRQGCAVFVNKIHADVDADGTNDQGFRDYVAYTAIHELGHVFNLWHVQDPPSFMVPNPSDFLKAFDFADDQKVYLQHAGDHDPTHPPYVLPGGSAFNDRGPIGTSGGDQPFTASEAASALKLEIRLSHQEFWHFEPVELDVQLSSPDPASGAVTIPDEIDPGYTCFEIWITRPDGERRRFRPLTHFCGNPMKRQLSHEQPFDRDISIFRQSGGYTFPMAGRYEIQAVLRLLPEKSVASNIVECQVLRVRPDSEAYLLMREAFMPAEVVELLRYRSRLPSRPHYLRLKRFADSHSSTASAAAVHYSLGRALIKSSSAEADARRSDRLRKQGLSHLEKAANHPQLSIHRCTIAERLLDEFATAKSYLRRRKVALKTTSRDSP